MDFNAVVQTAKQLHEEGTAPPLHRQLGSDAYGGDVIEEMYGRICNSVDANPPQKLGTSLQRKMVFLFGPDSISSIILKQNAYDMLLSLGFDQQYIYHQLIEKKYTFWLVLFKATANLITSEKSTNFFIVPATWDGIVQVTRTCYPDAYEDVVSNLDELKSQTLDECEKQAGFKFIDSMRNENSQDSSFPPFYSYQHYCSLPKPRALWQVRLFLYCEMRLLKLFKGDGFTHLEREGSDGDRGSKEYLCPNVPLSSFDPSSIAVMRMTVNMPENQSGKVYS